MGGVEVAIARPGVGAPPQSLALVGELDLAQVVQVAALGVQDLSEQPLAHQVEAEEFRPAVVHVFHHGAVAAGALGRLHEPPAVLQPVGGGHLGGRVFPVLHGGDAHRHVPAPGGGGVDQVEVLLGAQALEVALPAGVEGRAGVPRLLDDGGGPLGVGLHDVADGGDDAPVDAHEVAHVRGPHSAHADETDAHRVEGRGGEGPIGWSCQSLRDSRGGCRGGLGRRRSFGPRPGATGGCASRQAQRAGFQEVPAVEPARSHVFVAVARFVVHGKAIPGGLGGRSGGGVQGNPTASRVP